MLTPRIIAVIYGLFGWFLSTSLISVGFLIVRRELAPGLATDVLVFVLVLGLPPYLGFLAGRQKYRSLMGRYPLGHCQKCGYNLTGDASGICPECGTPVERDSSKRR